jgi:alpha-tubulin suppressor-like RCC1 family protein
VLRAVLVFGVGSFALLRMVGCFPSFEGLTTARDEPGTQPGTKDSGRNDASREEPLGDAAVGPTGDAGTTPVDQITLALGAVHGCARLPVGTVRCWGDNGAGQLGLGVAFDAGAYEIRSVVPRPVVGIDDAIAIGAGLTHSCVVHRTHRISCWGNNFFGQLGTSPTALERSEKPLAVAGVDDAIAVAGGVSFTCAIRSDKSVVCWGANYSGQLGDGMAADRPKPEPVKNLGNVVDISLGFDHGCAAHVDGTVSCWGGNTFGQLGNGGTAPQPIADKVKGLADVVRIASTESFVCALQRGGAVQCWGKNDRGQLGTGTASATPRTSPKPVPSLTEARSVSVGEDHACAVTKGGAVVCWGRADEGQVGTGVVVAQNTSFAAPVPVAGVKPARAVWTGGRRSCSITDDDHAFCWGLNDDGQLGNGSTDRAYAAVPVKNLP